MAGWKSFAAGAVVGLVAASTFFILRPQSKDPTPPNEKIIFYDKAFSDSAKSNGLAGYGYVRVIGTVVGDRLLYKNNTVTIQCSQPDMRCEVGQARQIGEDMVDDIDITDWPVSLWEPSEIVATSEEFCSISTITIERASEEVEWVAIPRNQEKPLCKDSIRTIQKWSVARSLGWQRLQPTKR